MLFFPFNSSVVGARSVRENQQRSVRSILLPVEYHHAPSLPSLHRWQDLHQCAAHGAGRLGNAGLLQWIDRKRKRDRWED